VNDDRLVAVLEECVDAVTASLEGQRGRGLSGQRVSQYHLDLAADAVAVEILVKNGLRVVSEESGVSGSGDYTVVLDPIDGSTNCDRGIPFFACSLAVVRELELVAGLVANIPTSSRYLALRGSGATRDGSAISARSTKKIEDAVVGFSGLPDRHLGWAQMRAMGAASLECCLVADGSLDIFTVAQHSTLHPWDYLAGLLIATESGAVAGDYREEELVIAQSTVRRPIIACTQELLDAALFAGPL